MIQATSLDLLLVPTCHIEFIILTLIDQTTTKDVKSMLTLPLMLEAHQVNLGFKDLDPNGLVSTLTHLTLDLDDFTIPSSFLVGTNRVRHDLTYLVDPTIKHHYPFLMIDGCTLLHMIKTLLITPTYEKHLTIQSLKMGYIFCPPPKFDKH